MALSVKNMLGGGGKVEFTNGVSFKSRLANGGTPIDKLSFANYYTYAFGGSPVGASMSNTNGLAKLLKLSDTIGLVASASTSGSYNFIFYAFKVDESIAKPYVTVGTKTNITSGYVTSYNVDAFAINENTAIVIFKTPGYYVFYKVVIANDLSLTVTELNRITDTTLRGYDLYFSVTQITETRAILTSYDVSNATYSSFVTAIIEYANDTINVVSNICTRIDDSPFSYYLYPICVSPNLVLLARDTSDLRITPVHINGNNVSFGTTISTGFTDIASITRFFIYKVKDNLYHLLTQSTTDYRSIYYFDITINADNSITVGAKKTIFEKHAYYYQYLRYDPVVKDGLLHIIRGENVQTSSKVGITTLLYVDGVGYKEVAHSGLETDSGHGYFMNANRHDNACAFSNNEVVFLVRMSTNTTINLYCHQISMIADKNYASSAKQFKACVTKDSANDSEHLVNISTMEYIP